MKTLEEIKQLARKGDYTQVAAIVGMSSSLVRMVINGERADHYNIQKTFSDLLTNREKLEKRERERQERKQIRNQIKQLIAA